jgi:hypothetical protein
VRNPKKDVLPILKSIMRTGVIWYKPVGAIPKPMKINITIWVFFDIIPWLEKLNKFNKKLKQNQPEKKIKEMCD